MRRQEERLRVGGDQPVALGPGEAEAHLALVARERDEDDLPDPELPPAPHLALVGAGQRQPHPAYGVRVGHRSVTSQKSPAGPADGREQRRELAQLVVVERPEREVGADQVGGGALDQRAAGVGDLGEDRPAVLGVRRRTTSPSASSRCTIEVTDVGCTWSRSPIFPSGSDPREEKQSSTSAS